jgi:hypothetical protein
MSYRCIVAMSALVMVGGRGAEQEEVADVGDGAPFPDLVETTETEPVGETSDALGVTCSSPADCVEKCVAEKKYCWYTIRHTLLSETSPNSRTGLQAAAASWDVLPFRPNGGKP